MGKLEKLVVLTVLFIAAVVLAVALNRGKKEEVLASGPLSAVQKVLEQEQEKGSASGLVPETTTAPRTPAADLEAEDDAREDSGARLLLNAGSESAPDGAFPPATETRATAASQTAGDALALEPDADPTGTTRRILTDTNGLRPSFLDEYMVYTAIEGDSWSSLAQRFYQDGRFTRNLQRANEDLAELRPGTEVLVPVFDFLEVDGGLPGSGTVASVTEPDLVSPADSHATRPAAPPAGGSGKTSEYVVQSGDTLSDISLAVFGTATRWKEIFDANRDKLQKPEWLQVGMKLKIPEGARLPITTAKPDSKPKTAQTSTSAPQPKKKKVL